MQRCTTEPELNATRTRPCDTPASTQQRATRRRPPGPPALREGPDGCTGRGHCEESEEEEDEKEEVEGHEEQEEEEQQGEEQEEQEEDEEEEEEQDDDDDERRHHDTRGDDDHAQGGQTGWTSTGVRGYARFMLAVWAGRGAQSASCLMCAFSPLSLSSSSLSLSLSLSFSFFSLSMHTHITNDGAVSYTRKFGFAFLCGITFFLLVICVLHCLPSAQDVLRCADKW